MKAPNKHPHSELTKKWLDDRNTAPEEFDHIATGVIDIDDVLADMRGKRQIRVKKVNLIIGHWYPCLDDGYVSVKMWDGVDLVAEEGDIDGVSPDSIDKIGESLGKISFE